MKEFLNGLFVFIGALIVSIVIMPIGFLYSMIYSFWLSISLKDWRAFFVFWWKMLDGMLAAIGHVLFNLGYGMDLIWNVHGEIVEDNVTHVEDTEFTKKNVSLSASIGKLEIDGHLNIFGRKLSKFLNLVFNQKAHCSDAWYYLQEKTILMSKYFQK